MSKTPKRRNKSNQPIESKKYFNINQHSDSEYRVISTQQSARSGALFPFQPLSALKVLAPYAN
uniref:hypothetical protein n=1 Tax=Candidatus Pantoea varia TaxID=1881036 RepID=UPI0011132FCB|nr:hypothetical protein [Pantoea varia]